MRSRTSVAISCWPRTGSTHNTREKHSSLGNPQLPSFALACELSLSFHFPSLFLACLRAGAEYTLRHPRGREKVEKGEHAYAIWKLDGAWMVLV